MGRTVLPSVRPRWPRTLICPTSRLKGRSSTAKEPRNSRNRTFRRSSKNRGIRRGAPSGRGERPAHDRELPFPKTRIQTAGRAEEEMKRFEGKVAVVTGGNSGIGLATAKRLHDEGARVAISGRSQKTLDEAVKIIGKDVLAVKADVAKPADLDKLYGAVAEAHFDEMFDINTRGAYFTIQKAVPHLNTGASIILNTSVADKKGIQNGTVYAATKAALRSFARSVAAELVDLGIRVNTVAPGPIETPIFERTGLPKEAIEEFAKGVLSQVPMKRFGKPEEVAGAVAFLASSDASYITGVEINVDGGMGQL